MGNANDHITIAVKQVALDTTIPGRGVIRLSARLDMVSDRQRQTRNRRSPPGQDRPLLGLPRENTSTVIRGDAMPPDPSGKPGILPDQHGEGINTMHQTQGINHLGLSVRDLEQTLAFFTDCLGWEESGRDDSYPRSAVSDGRIRLTLWQVDHSLDVREFQFRQNVGLHHVAFEVASNAELEAVAEAVTAWPGVEIEFMPEPVGDGPRRHMIFTEPGGIRLEFIWPGT